MAAKKQENLFSQTSSQTPVKKGAIIPSGHILVSGKWRGSSIVTTLKGKCKFAKSCIIAQFLNWLKIIYFMIFFEHSCIFFGDKPCDIMLSISFEYQY